MDASYSIVLMAWLGLAFAVAGFVLLTWFVRRDRPNRAFVGHFIVGFLAIGVVAAGTIVPNRIHGAFTAALWGLVLTQLGLLWRYLRTRRSLR